ncbi:hypothetical protein CEXT_401301 [Caerostris extrusa]|uniref:Uncharacterized protein n=1 Tax=Caerostris extrusa TaxID=172846 RepID=A0AAV4PEB2_CAEEX|nr:hypothetical protein CEXT_401301 [Caerostris extrusa]
MYLASSQTDCNTFRSFLLWLMRLRLQRLTSLSGDSLRLAQKQGQTERTCQRSSFITSNNNSCFSAENLRSSVLTCNRNLRTSPPSTNSSLS